MGLYIPADFGRLNDLTNASFAAAAVGSSAVTLVSAASNTDGLILHGLVIRYANSREIQLTAQSSAPSTLASISDHLLYHSLGDNTAASNPHNHSLFQLPAFIPAGNGLFAISGGASAGNLWVTYTLL